MKPKLIRILLPVILFTIVMIFWSILYMRSIQVFPVYTGEMNALKTLNWGNMWNNVLLSTPKYWYYRYSPTALFPLSLLDRDLIAPAMGIHFPSLMFKHASRLVYEGFLGAGLMSLAVYFLSITLEFTHFESFLAGLYVGVFKGISYFFLFASTIHAMPLLVIYSVLAILFFVKFLKSQRKKFLIGYYAFLLLAVGAWEQWVNLLAFLLIFSIFILIIRRKISFSIVLNGLIVPAIIFTGYMIVKYPAMKLEASNQGQEAEYVFSYPSERFMAEDMISNASLHVADAVESALFPWPMLSQTVLYGIDPNAINSYNKVSNNDKWSQSHYLAFSDWYAGLLFGLTFLFSIWLGAYIFRNPEEIYKAGTGLVLLWTGFIAHLPIMYRGMFIKPGWEGLLGYKHMLSVVGVALIIAWLFGKLDAWLKKKLLLPPSNSQKKYSLAFFTFFTAICIFLVFNNTIKIAVSWYLRSRGMPW
jgi:hypothetical protein